jgi:hypothetical protein
MLSVPDIETAILIPNSVPIVSLPEEDVPCESDAIHLQKAPLGELLISNELCISDQPIESQSCRSFQSKSKKGGIESIQIERAFICKKTIFTAKLSLNYVCFH